MKAGLVALLLTCAIACGGPAPVPTSPKAVAVDPRNERQTIDDQTVTWNATKCRWEDTRGDLVLQDTADDLRTTQEVNARYERCHEGLAYKQWVESLGLRTTPRVKFRP